MLRTETIQRLVFEGKFLLGKFVLDRVNKTGGYSEFDYTYTTMGTLIFATLFRSVSKIKGNYFIVTKVSLDRYPHRS